MKLSLRRPSDPPPTPDAAPAPPTPPRGRPVCAYAGILDGRSLWLAVEAAPGSLALRETGSGDVHALRSDLAEGDPAHRSVRVDLTDLPGGAEPASYDVVLVPPGGRSPRTVWTRLLPAAPDGSLLPTPDGTAVLDLRRTDDGTLQVRRRPLPPAVHLRAVAVEGTGLRVTVAGATPDAADSALALLDDGRVVASWPLAADGTAVLDAAALPPVGEERLTRVAAGVPGAWRHVTRHRNDLVNPGKAAMLPPLQGEDPDHPRLRLRWSGEATLNARLLGPAGSDA